MALLGAKGTVKHSQCFFALNTIEGGVAEKTTVKQRVTQEMEKMKDYE